MDESELFIKVGERIRDFRQGQSMSQSSLADECDFERSNMSRIEAGRTNLTLRSLFRISRALGVKLSDLLDVE